MKVSTVCFSSPIWGSAAMCVNLPNWVLWETITQGAKDSQGQNHAGLDYPPINICTPLVWPTPCFLFTKLTTGHGPRCARTTTCDLIPALGSGGFLFDPNICLVVETSSELDPLSSGKHTPPICPTNKTHHRNRLSPPWNRLNTRQEVIVSVPGKLFVSHTRFSGGHVRWEARARRRGDESKESLAGLPPFV